MALYENGKRISGIRDFPAYTWAEYQALPVAKRPKVWKCTDRDYTEIPRESVSVTADGVKTYGTLLSELYALGDRSKIGVDTALLFDIGTTVYNYKFCAMTASVIIFATGEISTQDNAEYLTFLFVLGSTSVAKYRKVKASSPYVENTSQTNSIPASGSKFTLYY